MATRWAAVCALTWWRLRRASVAQRDRLRPPAAWTLLLCVCSRAVFPPHCYDHFDAVRLCMMQRLDHHTCTEVYAAYAPCGEEMTRRRAAALRAREDTERRQRLDDAAAKQAKQ